MASTIGAAAAGMLPKIRWTCHYYRRYVDESEEELYGVLLDILNAHSESKYAHGICLVGDREIATDMMCFRIPARFWNWSERARMKVRIQYNQQTRKIAVICKKKYQLEAFIARFVDPSFNAASCLVCIGSV